MTKSLDMLWFSQVNTKHTSCPKFLCNFLSVKYFLYLIDKIKNSLRTKLYISSFSSKVKAICCLLCERKKCFKSYLRLCPKKITFLTFSKCLGHLAGSVSGAYDSWFQGHVFKPDIGRRAYLKNIYECFSVENLSSEDEYKFRGEGLWQL